MAKDKSKTETSTTDNLQDGGPMHATMLGASHTTSQDETKIVDTLERSAVDEINTQDDHIDLEQSMTKKADTTALATRSEAQPPANPTTMEKDIFEEYGDQISSRNIVGQLLKFSKGDYMSGQDNVEIPIGSKMIANMDELLLGWIRWEDSKPAEQHMGRLIDGFKAPARNELGFGYELGEEEPSDMSDWEIDETTKEPRDPWQFTYYLVMKDPTKLDAADDGDSEGTYTFTTSSSGGKQAIGDLCKVYGRKRREGYKEHYPVVALKVGSYNHSNKKFGRIKFPVFPVVGWFAKTKFGILPPPVDATEQLAAAANEDIPF